MPNLDRRAGPLRPISYTASELVAEKILTRLYRLPPKGMSWRQFAITESPPRFAPATPAGLFLLARHASCLTTLPGWSPAGCRLGVETRPHHFPRSGVICTRKRGNQRMESDGGGGIAQLRWQQRPVVRSHDISKSDQRVAQGTLLRAAA
jgi:hypothetical protein